MSGHFWLPDEQMERLQPFFPKSRGKPRIDDRRVLSGIIYIEKNMLQWKDAPSAYGSPRTLSNRFARWSRMGVFERIFIELAQPGPDGEIIMIDNEARARHRSERRMHLKAHRTAASLSKGGLGRHRTDQRRAELEVAHDLRR